jgi:hypothetical protein
MSYENIDHPDTHQFGDSREKMIAELLAEIKYMKRKYDRVCDDLRSIIERCEKGEKVYVVMKDGSRLYLKKNNEHNAL